MKDFGIADVRVRFRSKLPNIVRKRPTFNFDIHASQYPSLMGRSAFIKPYLIDYVEGETFAACFPSKSKLYRDNYILNSQGNIAATNDATYTHTGPPPINWKATTAISGWFYALVRNEENPFPPYDLKHPDEYNEPYIGPRFEPKPHSIETDATIADERTTLSAFNEFLVDELKDDTGEEEEVESDEEAGDDLMWVHQVAVKPGLWWALESEPFLHKNMPFFVNVKVQAPPTSSDFPTAIVISLGIDDMEWTNRYDLVISYGNRTRLYDYWSIDERGKEGSKRPYDIATFEHEGSKILGGIDNLEIGFMTIAGRLVIFLKSENSGDDYLVYERVNKDGTFEQSSIPQGRIRVSATNIQAGINVSPMGFAPLGAMALPISTIASFDGARQDLRYVGVPPDADDQLGFESASRREVCQLPQPPSSPTYGAPSGVLYGVDARYFQGENGIVYPNGAGYHRKGSVKFLKGQAWANSQNINLEYTDYYLVVMQPDDVTSPTLGTLKYAGTPYYFRLKGRADVLLEAEEDETVDDATGHLISLDEIIEAPDYFHVTKKAAFVLYNEGGRWDFLKEKQYGVEIEWGRDGVTQKSFTGLTLSAQSSETAGMETISVNCSDYFHILKSVPIINSPFYDGMIAFYAMKDIAKKGGIASVNFAWNDVDAYFLPAGFAFTKPAFRFDGMNTLFDCILDIGKLHEVYFYFDENGEMWIEYTPGGIISGGILGRSITVAYNFYSDPEQTPESVLIGSRDVETNFANVVNVINIFSVHRDTRNLLHYQHSADVTATGDKLLFDKWWFANKSEFGEMSVLRSYVQEVATRLFNTTKTISFQTVGSAGTDHIRPLDFVTVDGQLFRIMNMKRTFNAENNEYMIDFSAEILG